MKKIQFFIYALKNPNNGMYFYVGCTWQPETRLYQHCYAAISGKSERDELVRSITATGKKPIMEILKKTTSSKRNLIEKSYYQNLINEGYELLQNPGRFGLSQPSYEHVDTNVLKRLRELKNEGLFTEKELAAKTKVSLSKIRILFKNGLASLNDYYAVTDYVVKRIEKSKAA